MLKYINFSHKNTILVNNNYNIQITIQASIKEELFFIYF